MHDPLCSLEKTKLEADYVESIPGAPQRSNLSIRRFGRTATVG